MIHLKRDTRLESATCKGYAIKAIDEDCGETLWVYGQEFGPTMILSGRSFESAYEIMLDNSEAVSEADLHEAYGFDTDAHMRDTLRKCEQGWLEYPDLVEGYSHMPNSGDSTGVVNVGDYEWMRELEPSELRGEGSLRITVESW